jgi:hypothetical protein
MEINNIFNRLIVEQMVLKTTQSKPIVDAIKNRYPVSFYYSGPRKPKKESVKSGKRVKAEIVAMGLSKKGNLIVRAYVQPPSVSKKGYDKTNWRTFMVTRMSRIEVLNNETFNTQRPQYKPGDDKSMTVTYVTSDWTNKTPKVKKEVPPKPEPQTVPTVKNVPVKKEPIKKEVPKPEVKPTELPQPKPVTKPKKPEELQPQVKPEEPKPTELPQPKTTEKPENLNPENPEEEENNPINNALNEAIKRFKSLI